MVTKLIGKIDGLDIVFTRGQGDTWTCVFPIDGRTEAVVELSAYDDAGNVAYAAKYLVTFDPTKIHATLSPYKYQTRLFICEYTIRAYSPSYFAIIRGGDKNECKN